MSWIMGWLGELPLDNRQRRETVSSLVATEAIRLRDERERSKQKGETATFYSTFLRDVPELERVLDLFSQLGEVRNDLNHAGLRQGRMPAKTLASRTRKLCAELASFSLPGD